MDRKQTRTKKVEGKRESKVRERASHKDGLLLQWLLEKPFRGRETNYATRTLQEIEVLVSSLCLTLTPSLVDTYKIPHILNIIISSSYITFSFIFPPPLNPSLLPSFLISQTPSVYIKDDRRFVILSDMFSLYAPYMR